MNVKNNKRRRESISKIEKACAELLQTTELNKITVSDICKITKLNRSTFYANFSDIYDLADKMRKHIEEEFGEIYQEEGTAQGATDCLKMFRHIYNNQLRYKTFFKLHYDNDEIYLYDITQAEKYFDNKHVDYHIEFFRNGLNAIIKKWLAGGCKETPEEMTEIVISEYQGRL